MPLVLVHDQITCAAKGKANFQGARGPLQNFELAV
jgi:hypothetical protein